MIKRLNFLVFDKLALALFLLATPLLVYVSSANADTDADNISNLKIASKPQVISENDLATTEINILGRAYPNDPMTKRLQRLELLVFRSTQAGENIDRWHKLQNFLQNKNSASSNKNAKGNAAALNELEKYIFKKSNSSIATSMRLDKLETKLFGKANPNLGTERRIARLQRTLGFADTSGQMAELPNRGLRSGRGFEDYYFGEVESQMNQQMNQMMKEMQKQMQDQMRGYSLPPPGYNPKNMPEFSQPLIIPKQQEKLPNYNDPNFI